MNHIHSNCSLSLSLSLFSFPGFLIQYEDSLHDRGNWHNMTEVPGTKITAHLKLSPFVHYTFRVLALNEVGYSHPSLPSQQYRTKAAGKAHIKHQSDDLPHQTSVFS